MTAREIIDIYLSFFEKRGHTKIAGAPLVPLNDPTTLFTSSGMQPLITYLLGEQHPSGKRLVDVQNCFRAQDIDEIGDNRHTTFFRMLGNWSLGDYFKEEQLPWFFEFLTKELKIDPSKLYVTIFNGDENFRTVQYGKYHSVEPVLKEFLEGNKDVQISKNGLEQPLIPDIEAMSIWKNVFREAGIEAKVANVGNEMPDIRNGRIFLYGPEKNWWSRSGTPDKMPIGEPGGPDSEVFYDFGAELKLHENSSWKDNPCHPNCDCGRFMEIGNSVFMQYKKVRNDLLEELPNMNVDFGGGLERLVAATENQVDIFKTSTYVDIIKVIESYSNNKTYDEETNKRPLRIIADHLRAATLLILSGVYPSNKQQGYVLRSLLRRAAVKMHELRGGLTPIPAFEAICDEILRVEESIDENINRGENREKVFSILQEELEKFSKSLDKGLTRLEQGKQELGVIINKLKEGPNYLPMGRDAAKIAFDLYQSYGFPIDVFLDLLKKEFTIAYAWKADEIIRDEFNKLRVEHSSQSRTASSGMFKGGLADTQELTIKGHTATHLLHQAIRDLLGTQVHQSGSNITVERVRFDFNFDRKLTDEEIKKLEQAVNDKIQENLPVHFEMLPLDKAKELNAIGLFGEKYDPIVKVYFIGGSGKKGDYSNMYSKEFCGGPHVQNTADIKSFKITKQEKIGTGLMRLYAVVS